MKWGMNEGRQCSQTSFPLLTSYDHIWTTMFPVLNAFPFSVFVCHLQMLYFSLKSSSAGLDTDPLSGILNCLGILFLHSVVWLLKFNHCQNASVWLVPLLAPCLLMYAVTVIGIVTSLVSVSNVMQLPARCFLGLQNVLAYSLGAAVFI